MGLGACLSLVCQIREPDFSAPIFLPQVLSLCTVIAGSSPLKTFGDGQVSKVDRLAPLMEHFDPLQSLFCPAPATEDEP